MFGWGVGENLTQVSLSHQDITHCLSSGLGHSEIFVRPAGPSLSSFLAVLSSSSMFLFSKKNKNAIAMFLLTAKDKTTETKLSYTEEEGGFIS